MSIYSASKVTSGTKRPRSSSKTYSKESSLTGRGILNDDRDDSDDDHRNNNNEDIKDDDDDDGDGVQISAQDLKDYPILHPSYRDSISHVIHFMKKQNGGVIYAVDYQSEFQRCVIAYKASNDRDSIDQLFDYIATLCYDRVQTLGTLKGM